MTFLCNSRICCCLAVNSLCLQEGLSAAVLAIAKKVLLNVGGCLDLVLLGESGNIVFCEGVLGGRQAGFWR